MTYPVRIRSVRFREQVARSVGDEAGPRRVSEADQPGFRALVAGEQAVAAAAVALLVFLPVLTGRDPWPVRLVALACAAALAGVHLACFANGRGRVVPALVVQAALGYLPMLQLGAAWSAASGFFAGGLLLAVRPARAVPGAVLVGVVAGLVSARPGGPAGSVDSGVAGAVSAAVVALTLFGLGSAARLLAEREAERGELKRRAITEERQRFSRDLHDLLGLSLSAITLKGELVGRMLVSQPGRATEELSELLVMSRRALADVRAVAAGYRELSLDDECRAAATVLSAAGIRVTVAKALTRELPPPVATTLATVLREGVTNVVRHSTATWCAFSVSTAGGMAWLEIANDGAGGAADAGPCSGSGLRNLSDRVEAEDGTLTAVVDAERTHRLVAAIPLCAGQKDGHRRAS